MPCYSRLLTDSPLTPRFAGENVSRSSGWDGGSSCSTSIYISIRITRTEYGPSGKHGAAWGKSSIQQKSTSESLETLIARLASGGGGERSHQELASSYLAARDGGAPFLSVFLPFLHTSHTARKRSLTIHVIETIESPHPRCLDRSQSDSGGPTQSPVGRWSLPRGKRHFRCQG